ncbi:CHRD domain-containing protein [Mechercharimyces sp. CAU 1602]|uniref:CHRD domain-containing protein n=1 Tax=Mechercharimyces sp. CAU 1602 TaxID=2973933 RepID=UPI0021617EAE|nr:CHRD domain-containing protein [Mechercharimyces sp. CAU 1602]MCS1352079.1 CHRD domain-containing protein [Mechercharimyces sp. CAU 1602]
MSRTFFAVMKGGNEVPPIISNASGFTGFVFNRSLTKVSYSLNIANIGKMTQAHIHAGGPGINGPVVAFLFGQTVPGVSMTAGNVTFSLTKENLVGPLEGKTIGDLFILMGSGESYVNVHTEQNPPGEIRGQIEKITR